MVYIQDAPIEPADEIEDRDNGHVLSYRATECAALQIGLEIHRMSLYRVVRELRRTAFRAVRQGLPCSSPAFRFGSSNPFANALICQADRMGGRPVTALAATCAETSARELGILKEHAI